MSPTRTALLWSGGKDAALALAALRQRDDLVVDRLVTMVDADCRLSTVHDVPLPVLEAQADCVQLPLEIVPVDGDDVGSALRDHARVLVADGIDAVATGDLTRSGSIGHRRATFWPMGLDVIAPLYELESADVIERCWQIGLVAAVVVVDAALLPRESVGVALDRRFVADLPEGADPAGELGEYHTFVTDGPGFASPLSIAFDPAEEVVRTIGTIEGAQRFGYWVARPRLAPDDRSDSLRRTSAEPRRVSG